MPNKRNRPNVTVRKVRTDERGPPSKKISMDPEIYKQTLRDTSKKSISSPKQPLAKVSRDVVPAEEIRDVEGDVDWVIQEIQENYPEYMDVLRNMKDLNGGGRNVRYWVEVFKDNYTVEGLKRKIEEGGVVYETRRGEGDKRMSDRQFMARSREELRLLVLYVIKNNRSSNLTKDVVRATIRLWGCTVIFRRLLGEQLTDLFDDPTDEYFQIVQDVTSYKKSNDKLWQNQLQLPVIYTSVVLKDYDVPSAVDYVMCWFRLGFNASDINSLTIKFKEGEPGSLWSLHTKLFNPGEDPDKYWKEYWESLDVEFEKHKAKNEKKSHTDGRPPQSKKIRDPEIIKSLIGLGLSDNLNPTVKKDAVIIRKQYKKLARMYHPNMAKNVGDPNASRKFQEIGSFYTYLESKDLKLYAAKKNKKHRSKKHRSKKRQSKKRRSKKRRSMKSKKRMSKKEKH